MSRYRKVRRERLWCNEEVGGCGAVFTADVSVDKLSGVAGVTCSCCGKTQEPYPAETARRHGKVSL